MILWSRPSLVASAPWCVVHRIDASVHTLCDGRWASGEPREEASGPGAPRCGRCARLLEIVEHAQALGVRRFGHPLDGWCAIDAEPDEFPEISITDYVAESMDDLGMEIERAMKEWE